MKKRRPIAFMNAYSQGKSGGDMVFIEIAKRLQQYNLLIVTSALGATLCRTHGLLGRFIITSSEPEFTSIITTYIKRTMRALRLPLSIVPGDTLLGTSDFLPDVLPLFFLKRRHRNTQWIQHIFHLIPRKRVIPYISQQISLRLIRWQADQVIVDNMLLKKTLERFGIKNTKISVIYPGVSQDLPIAVSWEKKRFDGVFMAQLRQSKGIIDLIKIWKLVCKQKPNALLAIIGTGRQDVVNSMHELIGEHKLTGTIEVKGFLADDEAFSVMAHSRVFVFPSHEEGFGIAPLQAQAIGLPVVAWRLPVFTEVFRQGMKTVPFGSHSRFAQEVLQLIANRQYYNLESGYALENAVHYNWDRAAKEVLRIIEHS